MERTTPDGSAPDSPTARAPFRTRLATRIRASRRLTVVGIAALMLAVPVAVSASHVFSDVPTSSTYHTTVARLVGAGITGGCGSGKYCPNAAVTRGQMAAFLNRGLGRAAQDAGFVEDDDWASLSGGLDFPAVTYLQIGGGTGGTAHVLVNGTIAASTDEAAICPCELRMALLSEIGEMSPISSTQIADVGSPEDGERRGSGSMSYLFTVPTGIEVGFAIIAIISPTLTPSPENVASSEYSLQATYVPFAADGGNPPEPIVVTGEPTLPFGSWPFKD